MFYSYYQVVPMKLLKSLQKKTKRRKGGGGVLIYIAKWTFIKGSDMGFYNDMQMRFHCYAMICK